MPLLSDIRPKAIALTLLNVAVLMLAFVGGAHLADYTIGDGEIPRFRNLYTQAPSLYCGLSGNSTPHLKNGGTKAAFWQGMQPALKILAAINPSVANWVRGLQAEDRLEYQLLPFQKVVFPWEIIAAYDANYRVLRFGTVFWTLPDGDKAAYLAHEYRHSRQNRGKVLANLTAKVFSGNLLTYGNRLEDEAYLYQLDAYRAMNYPYYSILPYVHSEHLIHYEDLGQLARFKTMHCGGGLRQGMLIPSQQ